MKELLPQGGEPRGLFSSTCSSSMMIKPMRWFQSRNWKSMKLHRFYPAGLRPSKDLRRSSGGGHPAGLAGDQIFDPVKMVAEPFVDQIRNPLFQMVEMIVQLTIDQPPEYVVRLAELVLEHFTFAETYQQRLGVGSKGVYDIVICGIAT